jgi:hypothetical protein
MPHYPDQEFQIQLTSTVSIPHSEPPLVSGAPRPYIKVNPHDTAAQPATPAPPTPNSQDLPPTVSGQPPSRPTGGLRPVVPPDAGNEPIQPHVSTHPSPSQLPDIKPRQTTPQPRSPILYPMAQIPFSRQIPVQQLPRHFPHPYSPPSPYASPYDCQLSSAKPAMKPQHHSAPAPITDSQPLRHPQHHPQPPPGTTPPP